jgi:hypothetical protein
MGCVGATNDVNGNIPREQALCERRAAGTCLVAPFLSTHPSQPLQCTRKIPPVHCELRRLGCQTCQPNRDTTDARILSCFLASERQIRGCVFPRGFVDGRTSAIRLPQPMARSLMHASRLASLTMSTVIEQRRLQLTTHSQIKNNRVLRPLCKRSKSSIHEAWVRALAKKPGRKSAPKTARQEACLASLSK